MANRLSILLTDWTWMALDSLRRRRDLAPVVVQVFGSRRGAERARRTYGRGAWLDLEVVHVWPTRQ